LTVRIETSTIELVEELHEVSQWLDDPDITEALKYVVKMIENPDVTPAIAAYMVTKLTGLSAKFSVNATYYKGRGSGGTGEAGKPTRHKKDMYYTLADVTLRLADALKYTVRANEIR